MLHRGNTTFSLNFLLILLFAFLVSAYAINLKNTKEAAKLADYAVSEAAIMTNKAINKVNVEHIKCLATNIYHEAGNEPFMGQVAVARVVMNRVKHRFGSNPCKVIYQASFVNDDDEYKKVCQFSWVCAGKGTPQRNANYIQAEHIAKKVLFENKWAEVVPSNVLFFHSVNVNPMWNYKKVMTIGNHIFYSKQQKQVTTKP